MTMPKFPTRSELAKLSRKEITAKLAEYELEWRVFPVFDDPHDPFLREQTPSKEEQLKQEFTCNVGRLRLAPFHQWIQTLTAAQMTKLRKAYKIDASAWAERTATLEDQRRAIGVALMGELT